MALLHFYPIPLKCLTQFFCFFFSFIFPNTFSLAIYISVNNLTQVETCQEKIISLELKDPITDATLPELQLLSAKSPEPMTISPSDDENSSIITVCSNDNTEHLAHLHFVASNSSAVQIQCASTSTTTTKDQHLARCDQASIDTEHANASEALEQIVQVLNPLIAGDGLANEIIVGRSKDSECSSVLNDAVDMSNDDYNSLVYSTAADEISLSDKMKNVLQELVETERMKKLNVAESGSDVDSVDGEKGDAKDDTDAENEPLQLDDIADELDRMPLMVDAMDGKKGSEMAITTTSELNANQNQDSDSHNDDIKNANTFDDFVYENPNFLMAKEETDVNVTQQHSANRNQRDIKLKEKLLSELNVQATAHDGGKSAEGDGNVYKQQQQQQQLHRMNSVDDECSSLSLHEDISTSSADTSSRGTNNNTNTSTSGKRKKRKNRGKK